MSSEGRVIIKRIKEALGEDWAIRLITDLRLKKATVYSWDANQSPPKVLDLLKIAKYLKTTIEELVDGEKGKEYLLGLLSKELRFPGVRADLVGLIESIERLSPESLGLIRASVERFLMAEGKEAETGSPAASGGKNP
jgi:hypothetical protein